MNLHLFPHSIAEMNAGEIIAIVSVAGGLVIALIIAVLILYFRHRQSALWHETARVALEKGQPIPQPPNGLDNHGLRGSGAAFGLGLEQRVAHQRAQRIRGYLIGGLMNLAIGASTFLAFTRVQHIPAHIKYFAAIPAFIGLALLLGAAIEALVGGKLDHAGKQRDS